MAMNEYYVTDAGAGDGSGQPNEANAMSFATFVDFMSTGGTHTAAAGDRFNVKGAITARTTTVDNFTNGGTVVSPVVIRGYNTTIGDLTSVARTNGNGALVTTNYPTISYTTGRIVVAGNFIIVEALQVSGANVTANAGNLTTTGTDVFVKRCNFFNTSTNANAVAIGLQGVRSAIIDCDASLTGASGGDAAIANVTSAAKIIGCRVKGGPNAGIRCGIQATVIAFNTVYVSTGIGISLATNAGNYVVLYNTIVGGGADGINVVTGTTTTNILIGNMITDNTGDGIDMVSTSNGAYVANNRFRDNANTYNNAGNWITATSYNDVTVDTGGPSTDYVASGSNDYNLIYASPATSAGNPAFADIGALQQSITPELRIPSIGSI